MDRIFIVLACICAVATAQFGSQFNSRFQQPTTQRYQTNQYQYQQDQYSQQAQPAQRNSAGACRELNERYPVSGSCDRYVECINGTSEEKTCPDGLRFNPNVNFNVYPCQYPNEVTCLERSALQPPQPTEQCPNQFGYFKLGDARNCSGFRTCVNGVGFDFVCPEGLAWSSASYRCEWPDEVEDCDAEAFLGFRCPEVPQSRELGPPAGFRYYRASVSVLMRTKVTDHVSVPTDYSMFSIGRPTAEIVKMMAKRLIGSDANCQKYFICIEGRPRVLSCGSDAAFDDLTSSCVSADEVSACPAELRAAAASARESEKQLLAKELEFNAKSFGKSKSRF